MVFVESLVITYLIPLVTLGGSKDRKIIIEDGQTAFQLYIVDYEVLM